MSDRESRAGDAVSNATMTARDATLSCIILAGGEGLRVRAPTRSLAGDDRPEQFCRPVGGETRLEQTRQRAARLVAPASTVVVVTRAHERFYATQRQLAAQPVPA